MFALNWQLPYDWSQMLGLPTVRAVEGVETVKELGYVRSLSVGGHRSLVRVAPDLHANVLHATSNIGLRLVASECLVKITRLFDLDCYPQQIIATLDSFGVAHPGLHLSGSVDAPERGVRVILGWLANVLMAAKLTAKVAYACGEALRDTPEYACFPAPEALVNTDPLHPKALGMPLRHAGALIHLARAILEGTLAIIAPADIEQGVKQLQTSPGIGCWIANYFALRGWQTKDVFLPDGCLVKQRSLGMTPTQIRRCAERWKPWRSYVLLYT